MRPIESPLGVRPGRAEDRPRVAVVTGAARGIGAAIARGLADCGHVVVLAEIDRERGEAAAAALRDVGAVALLVPTDVRRPEDVENLVDRTTREFGGVDALVNNAGVTGVIDFFDVTRDDWDDLFAVNARGYFLLMQAAARRMRDDGGGSIVNISSVAGKGWRETTNIAYASSKGAVITMTRIAAATLGRHGIRVNAICPGMTRTDMMQDWLDHRAAAAGVPGSEPADRFTATVALGRLMKPSEIASAAVFLASPASEGITGQSINVDGGLLWD